MKIALIGRANVGKSSLFNRLVEKRTALQTDIPGTTRDRHQGTCYWKGVALELVDTPGLKSYELRVTSYELLTPEQTLEQNVQAQAKQALREADVILYILDNKTGPVGEDYEIIKKLRREKNKIVRLVVNKADTEDEANEAIKYQKLGCGEPLPTSAKNGRGTGELLDELIELAKPPLALPLRKGEKPPCQTLSLVIVGKPNVGKSSLFNAILKEERVVVSPVPHTTRDPNDTEITYRGYAITLVDTAGLRKKARVYGSDVIEIFSVKKTLEKLKRADIALLMIDASEGIGMQDRKIAGLIEREKNGLIIAANKWDAIPEKTAHAMPLARKRIYGALRAFGWAPIVFTAVRDPMRGRIHGIEERFLNSSSVIGSVAKQSPHALLDLAVAIYENRMRQIGDKELRAWWKRAVKKHPTPRFREHASPKVINVEQTGVNPPRFSVAIPKNTNLPAHYLGYLENELRKEFGFWGTGIVLFEHNA